MNSAESRAPIRAGASTTSLGTPRARRLSTKTKVTLGATSLFLLSLALVSSIQLYYVKDEMRRVLADQQFTFVSQVADDLDQKLLLIRDAIAAAAKALPTESVGDVGSLEKWAAERVSLRSLFTEIFVLSSAGKVLVDVPARGRHGIEVSDLESFHITLATRQPYISKPFLGKFLKQPIITISAPVFDGQGRVIAILTGSLNLLQPNFLGKLGEVTLGKSGSFAIFTRDRVIVTSRDRSRIMTQGPAPGVSPYFDRATAGLNGSEEAVNSRGLQAIFSYKQLAAVPWVLVASLPVDEAYAPIEVTRRRIVEVTLLLGLLIAPLVWLAVQYLYDPLQKALREREAGLRRAQSMAKLAHIITAPDGSFESWSETLPQLSGMAPAQMPASTRAWLELLHPDDQASFRARTIEAADSRQRTDQQYRLQRPDGTSINILQAMEPLEQPGADGRSRWFHTLLDVTEQKRAEEDLHRFRLAMDNSADMIVLIDRASMQFIDVNATACKLLGYSRTELLAMGPHDVLPVSRTDLEKSYDEMIGNASQPSRMNSYYLCKDGSRLPFESTRRVLRSGDAWIIVAISRDIRERIASENALRQSEAHLKRLNRVYAVLSGINALIVRVGNRNELFKEACRIAVEVGKFPLAWVGIVNAEMRVAIVASSGNFDEYLQRVATALNENVPQGRGLTAQAISERKAIVVNDIATDPQILIKEDVLTRGFRSLITLPLLVAGKPIGVLTLCAEHSEFFDEEEVKLLLELAGDISFAVDHLEKTEKIDYLAYYDALTGLANRTLFLERLQQKLLAASGTELKLAVFFLDLERFKTINDAFGRAAGDQLLQQVADRLTGVGRDPTRLARIGADHFAIITADVQNVDDVGRLSERRLHECFDPPYRIADQELRIAARLGIAMFPNDGEDAETLLRNAEAALKKAKATGERYLFFAQEMTERIAEKLSLESKLRQALEKEEFVLHYQPKVELETRSIVGVEALIRWQSSERGLVPPLQFIPLLEETGLILQVGSWALKRASLDHRSWAEQGLKAPRVAVNVSPIQLRQRNFVEVIEQAIRDGLAPTGIDLEITESLIMEDIQGNIQKLNAVRALGVNVAIDDFGTGYSSLGYLAKLPVQALKIDRSFINAMSKDPNAMTLVSTIISLAHSLRLKVIAEGVETEEQANFLRLLRCDEMQGYLFSKPLPVDGLIALLRSLPSRVA
jgi:diguanylate cyclase (GGDEF)-like protein/PAS domain S-box-containing protein